MNIHAFMEDSYLVDNNTNVVSTYGELSAKTRTYSKDIKVHGLGSVIMNVFSSVSDTSDNTVPPGLIGKIFQIHSAVTAITGSPTPSSVVSFMETNGVTAASISEPVVYYNGTKLGYSKLSFSYDGDQVTLWHKDSAMRADYPYTEHEVILPVDTLIDLEAPETDIREATAAASLTEIHNKAMTAAGDIPFTSIHTDAIGIYETGVTTPSTNPIPVNFTVISRGPKGDLYSERRAAIKAYIIEHAGTSLTTWQEIIGRDLFGSKEMMILPFWNEVQSQQGPDPVAYAGFSNVSGRLADIHSIIDTYSPDHIDQYAVFMPFQYRYITLAFIPNTNNSTDNLDISAMFPDYTMAPNEPDNVSFTRMSLETRRFINFIHEMLIKAEGYDSTKVFTHSFVENTENGLDLVSGEFQRAGDSSPLLYKMVKRS